MMNKDEKGNNFEMIYEENPPSFEQLMDCLNNIKLDLQQLDWSFDLIFPIQKG